jgi:hypothetical protein
VNVAIRGAQNGPQPLRTAADATVDATLYRTSVMAERVGGIA